MSSSAWEMENMEPQGVNLVSALSVNHPFSVLQKRVYNPRMLLAKHVSI